MATRLPSGAKPLLVASARPEVQRAVHELTSRGCEIHLAAPLGSFVAFKVREGYSTKARQAYGWPKLYPVSQEDMMTKSKKAPDARPLMQNATDAVPHWL